MVSSRGCGPVRPPASSPVPHGPVPTSLPETSSLLAALPAPALTTRRYDSKAARSGYSSLRHPDRVPIVRSTIRRRAPKCGRTAGCAPRHCPKHRTVCPVRSDTQRAPSGPIRCRGRCGAATAHFRSRLPEPPVPPRADRFACFWHDLAAPVLPVWWSRWACQSWLYRMPARRSISGLPDSRTVHGCSVVPRSCRSGRRPAPEVPNEIHFHDTQRIGYPARHEWRLFYRPNSALSPARLSGLLN